MNTFQDLNLGSGAQHITPASNVPSGSEVKEFANLYKLQISDYMWICCSTSFALTLLQFASSLLASQNSILI